MLPHIHFDDHILVSLLVPQSITLMHIITINLYLHRPWQSLLGAVVLFATQTSPTSLDRRAYCSSYSNRGKFTHYRCPQPSYLISSCWLLFQWFYRGIYRYQWSNVVAARRTMPRSQPHTREHARAYSRKAYCSKFMSTKMQEQRHPIIFSPSYHWCQFVHTLLIVVSAVSSIAATDNDCSYASHPAPCRS